jgi:hypothetical protein
MRYTVTVSLLVILVQGCTTLRPYPEPSLSSEESMCLRWLEDVEATLEKYAIYDYESVRITGFPHLRVNRFLASTSDRVTSQDAFAEWLEQMRILDSTGKKLGFANLPAPARQQLATKKPAESSFNQALEHCGKRLNKLSLNNPEHKIKGLSI